MSWVCTNVQHKVKQYSESCAAYFVMVLAQAARNSVLVVLLSFGKFLRMLARFSIMYLKPHTYLNAEVT